MLKNILAAASLAVGALLVNATAQADTINFGGASCGGNTCTGTTLGGDFYTAVGPGNGFLILSQGSTWGGTFNTGTAVLFDNYIPGAVTFDFANPLTSFTMAVESNYYGAYTAYMTAYDGLTDLGTISVGGVSGYAPGTAPSLTFSGPITSVVIASTNDGLGIGLGSGVSGVPEPATWTMMLIGFGLVGSQLRRRSAVAA